MNKQDLSLRSQIVRRIISIITIDYVELRTRTLLTIKSK